MPRNQELVPLIVYSCFIVIVIVIFFKSQKSRESEKEMLEVYKYYSILNKNDVIKGVVTEIYEPGTYRYAGRHTDLTIDDWKRISLYVSLDTFGSYLSIRQLIREGDSFIKHGNTEFFTIKKKESNECYTFRIDTLYAKEMTNNFLHQN